MSIHLHQPAVRMAVSLDTMLDMETLFHRQHGPDPVQMAESAVQAGADVVVCSVDENNLTQRLALLKDWRQRTYAPLECHILGDLQLARQVYEIVAKAADVICVSSADCAAAFAEEAAANMAVELSFVEFLQTPIPRIAAKNLRVFINQAEWSDDMATGAGWQALCERFAEWRAIGCDTMVSGNLPLPVLQNLLKIPDIAGVQVAEQIHARVWSEGWEKAIRHARATLMRAPGHGA